jgi:hypothetical protein
VYNKNMENDFKLKPSTEKSIEVKEAEYTFEEGVAESVKRITELFDKLDRHVFVVIFSSGTDVGKTYLLGALGKALQFHGIPIKSTGIDADNPKTKTVIFTTKQGTSYRIHLDIMRKIRDNNPNFEIGGKLMPADINIGIYSPDKKFLGNIGPLESGDLLICNKEAKDKSYKFK